MFTGQAAETILGFFPPSLQSTKSTNEQSQREQGTQLQKNIKAEDNLSALLRRAKGGKPKHGKEENTRELNKRK